MMEGKNMEGKNKEYLLDTNHCAYILNAKKKQA